MKLHHLIRVIKIVLLKILIINFVNMKNTLSIPRFLLLIVLFLSITLVRTVYFAFHLSVCVKLLHLCPTVCDPMDCSPQAPLSMELSGQEHWSRLSCPPPGESSQSRV